MAEQRRGSRLSPAALGVVLVAVAALVGLVLAAFVGSLSLATGAAGLLGVPLAVLGVAISLGQLRHEQRVVGVSVGGVSPSVAHGTRPSSSPAGEAVGFVGVPDRRGFFGRERELDLLGEATIESAAVEVITGMAGVGKTALAVEHCHRRREAVRVVRWLVADQRSALVQAYLDMAPTLGLVVEGLPPMLAIARVRTWFETTSLSWLLVFDNADDPSVLEGLLPDRGNGQIVITSRDRIWYRPGCRTIELGVLDRADALEVLVRRAGRPETDVDDPVAALMVDRLGCLALAVEQAGACLAATRWSYDRYMETLKAHAGRLFRMNKADLRRLSSQEMVVATVWDTSIDRAVREAPAAAELLAVLAFLAPDAIPRRLFDEMDTGGFSFVCLGDPLAVDEAFGALERYYLIDVFDGDPSGSATGSTHEHVTIHRLIQDVTRLQPHGSVKPSEACRLALRLVINAMPTDARDPRCWPDWTELLPHALVLVHHTQETGIDPPTTGRLLSSLSEYFFRRGGIRNAHAHASAALDLQVLVLGDDHPDTLASKHRLANALHMLAAYEQARELYEETAEARQRILGPEDRETLKSMTGLANTLLSLGRYEQGRDLHDQILRVRNDTVGADDPDTLEAMNNLAVSLRALGDLQGAHVLHQRTLDARRRVLGQDHPQTLQSMKHLGRSLQTLGDHQGARDLHAETLEGRRRVLGEDHHSTLASMDNLACSLQALGDHQRALELYRATLAARCRVLGDEHPYTLQTMTHLAALLQTTGDQTAARHLYEGVLASRRRVLGDEHPATIESQRIQDELTQGLENPMN